MHQSVLLPVSRLPAEVLSNIFELVKLDNPFTCKWIVLTHVCLEWRQIALTHKKLWTTIHVSNSSRDMPLAFLERSHGCMVNVEVISWGIPMHESVARGLSDRVEQLSSFRLGIWDRTNFEWPIIAHSAPNLRDMKLFCKTDHVRLSVIPFRGVLPELRNLSLERFSLPWGGLCLNNLKSLNLYSIRSSEQPSIGDMLKLLSCTPLLERLRISQTDLTDEHQATGTFSGAIDLPRLNAIDIWPASSGRQAFTDTYHLLLARMRPANNLDLKLDLRGLPEDFIDLRRLLPPRIQPSLMNTLEVHLNYNPAIPNAIRFSYTNHISAKECDDYSPDSIHQESRITLALTGGGGGDSWDMFHALLRSIPQEALEHLSTLSLNLGYDTHAADEYIYSDIWNYLTRRASRLRKLIVNANLFGTVQVVHLLHTLAANAHPAHDGDSGHGDSSSCCNLRKTICPCLFPQLCILELEGLNLSTIQLIPALQDLVAIRARTGCRLGSIIMTKCIPHPDNKYDCFDNLVGTFEMVRMRSTGILNSSHG